MKTIFQQVYDAEINFEIKISCFWDSGFTVKLGDSINGYKGELHVDKWDEVEVALEILYDKLKEEGND